MPGTTEAWQVPALGRIAALKELAAAIDEAPPKGKAARELFSLAKTHLAEAEDSVESRLRPARVGGWAMAASSAHADAAEILLLRVADDEQFASYLPSVTHRVRTHLAPADPRRERFNEMLRRSRFDKGTVDREAAVAALRAVSDQRVSGWERARSLQPILLVAVVGMTFIACTLAVLGALRPEALSLCFQSGNRTACPLGDTPRPGDVALVELAGLVGAALSGAVALRRFDAPQAVSLLLLKLPTGALCALVGLMLMKGDFLPGMGELDSRSQIIAWALVFGSAQQLLTRQVDSRMHQVLEDAMKLPVSPMSMDEWDDLLDQRLREVEAHVSATVGDLVQDRIRGSFRGPAAGAVLGAITTAVGLAVQRSLRGPEIIAFSGFVTVTLHHPDGSSVAADAAGPRLAPDHDYTLRVRVSTEEPEQGATASAESEAMSIAGRAGEIAVFAFVPEIEGVAARPDRRETNVRTSQGTAVCDFALHTPDRQGECPGWVAVYQHSRLAHVVRLRLLIGAEA